MRLGAVYCKLFGHRRGKKVALSAPALGPTTITYACPRCGAKWFRKLQAPKPAPSIPASLRKAGP